MRNCLGGNSKDALTGNETQSGTHGRRRPEMVRSAPVKSNYTDIGKQIVHKTQKRSDFSIASMSGWEDSNFRPLEPHSSTLPNCATPSHVPKASTLAEGVDLANRTNYSMFPAPCQEGKCLFLWFFAKSNAKNHKHDALCQLALFRRFFHEFVKILDDFLRVVAFFCVIPDLLEKLIETLICHVQCHLSVK